MQFRVGGKVVREFTIEYATGERDFEVFADVSAFHGQQLTVQTKLPGGSPALAGIIQSDALPSAATLYQEALRPRYHFTCRRGWHNDPNGLVYFAGEYHLYFQHNPYGIRWGNMHWGHAVSPDLVHWRELPTAIYPPRFGDWAFSGSAAVDWENTSGFGDDGAPPLIAAWTSTGRGEVISYSRDRGRTFQEYAGNPVIKHRGRDPMIFWHVPTRRWVMVVYDETKGGRDLAFYTSPNLKEWTFRSRLTGYYECPNLFELSAADRAGDHRWIVFGGDGRYAIGQFDGESFRTESGPHQLWHGNFYASQTYNNAPNGRRIQIGWARGVTFPGMPFSQQMTLPVELTLRDTPAGWRMFGRPMPKLEVLQRQRHVWPKIALTDEARLLDGVRVDATRVQATLKAGNARRVGFRIRGQEVAWAPLARQLWCGPLQVPLEFSGDTLKLDLWVDRGSIEVFVNDGQAILSQGFHFPLTARGLEVFCTEGRAEAREVVVSDLASIWPEPERKR
jgi:fructan beta-fructosidase